MNKSVENCASKTNPYENSSILSKLTFWWLRDLFKLGLSQPIEQEDLYETLKDHKSKPLTKRFATLWKNETKKRKPSLLRAMCTAFGQKLLIFSICYNLVDTFAKVLQPQFLGRLVSFFSPGQTEIEKTEAYLYGLGIVLCSLFPIIIFHPFVFYGFQIGMKLRLAACSLIYNKALKLTKSASVDGLSGQVINLMSNDVSRFDFSTGYVNDLFKGPLEMFIFGYFIYREISFYGLIGIGCLLSFVPLQTYMGKKAAKFRLSTAIRTDKRVRFMNEIIQGIQVIKMYTWEKSFASVVDKVRRKEISTIRGTLFIRGTLMSFNMISRLSIFLSLVSFVYFGNIFTARKVFIVTSYFTSLYTSLLHFWPLAITYLAELYISVMRVQQFLLIPEHKAVIHDENDGSVETDKLLKNGINEKNGVQKNGIKAKDDKPLSRRIANRHVQHPSVVFKNTTADWVIEGKSKQAGIRSINLDIQPGRLCTITGQVGSGKSTLLQVILGELEVDSGSLLVNGSVSYASQEPWLFEGSVRKNITFIDRFDEKRYREVVKVCALERDLELFPYGDATIVGERGVSLSGGQRARINLARAIYREADIYLLDDPLSAVDTHVGKHIFEKCIQQYLCNKVVILVTHQLQHLKNCKQVVVMDKGLIEAQGTYNEIKTSESFSVLESASADDKKEDVDERKEPLQLRKGGKQVEEKETQMVGDIGFTTFKAYFQAVHSWFFIFFVAFLFIAAQTAISSVDYFVAKWVNWEESVAPKNFSLNINATAAPLQINTLNSTVAVEDALISQLSNITANSTILANEGVSDKRYFYIQTYSIAIFLVLFMVLNRTFCFFQMCIRASINLHDKLFRGITRATMYFFNTNPSGRILNRFSKDIGAVDTALPVALMDCLVFFVELIAIVTLVSIVNYWLLVPTFVMSLVFYGLRHVYVNTARSVKRLEALTRSPVFSHANATLQGLSTIRAFRAEEILSSEFDNHQDLNTSAWYLFLATARAFALWLEVTCVLYSASVIFSFLLFPSEKLGGNVGLAITQCFNLIFICQWGMRQSAELVNQMTSVERVVEYTNLKQEPPLESENKYRPPNDWPQHGAIRFSNLNLRYSEKSELILRDLNFVIQPKEKIGIVGRTGAGKSSIIQAIFRLAINEGVIEIDGIDTATLGLHDLRSRISIIPQDPIIFSGTLRYNLDPFGQKTDEEIWKALEQVELKSVCQLLPHVLDFKMSDGGSNFSMGQRQLVCLARAILRNNKILVLDEATANVDPETDKLIQTTIRSQFSECTVLTIAHRLHTVTDSDRVLVMDAGRVVEYAHAYELLQKPGGFFKTLVDQTGTATAAILTELAKNNYKKPK